jgi:hypothetical protein
MTIRRITRADRWRDAVRVAAATWERGFGRRPADNERWALNLRAVYATPEDALNAADSLDEYAARKALGAVPNTTHDEFAGTCTECDATAPDIVLVRVGDDPSEYDGSTVDLCPDCVRAVVRAMENP